MKGKGEEKEKKRLRKRGDEGCRENEGKDRGKRRTFSLQPPRPRRPRLQPPRPRRPRLRPLRPQRPRLWTPRPWRPSSNWPRNRRPKRPKTEKKKIDLRRRIRRERKRKQKQKRKGEKKEPPNLQPWTERTLSCGTIEKRRQMKKKRSKRMKREKDPAEPAESNWDLLPLPMSRSGKKKKKEKERENKPVPAENTKRRKRTKEKEEKQKLKEEPAETRNHCLRLSCWEVRREIEELTCSPMQNYPDGRGIEEKRGEEPGTLREPASTCKWKKKEPRKRKKMFKEEEQRETWIISALCESPPSENVGADSRGSRRWCLYIRMSFDVQTPNLIYCPCPEFIENANWHECWERELSCSENSFEVNRRK
jgi:hypothetical protein